MLVSVIIPCYGEGRFLDACLKSVRAQTHADLDIIVIDDGGQGDSLGQALPHAIADNRIRLFQQAPNCGLGACRNAALNAALADWVVFLDGDDLLTPNAISAHVARVNEIIESDTDVSDFVGVYGDWGHIVETGTVDTKVRPTRKGLGRVTWASSQAVNPFIVSAPLVKKEAILRVGGFAEHTSAGEDFIAWMKLLRSGGWLDYTTETVTLYRQKASSMLRNSALELLAVLSEVQKLYFSDFKNGVPIEELNEPPRSPHGPMRSGQPAIDVRNRPVFRAPENPPKADPHFEVRRNVVSQELVNAIPAKVRDVFELASAESGIWTVRPADRRDEPEPTFSSAVLAVAESRAELIEAALTARAIDARIDILVPETLLSGVSDLDFTGLGNVRILLLDQAQITFDEYNSLLIFRDWGPVFEAVRGGFGGRLPKRTVLKSCGISALNWKPLGAAKRYRLPNSRKLVQGAADEVTLFSRGISVVGSPIVDAFAKPAGDIKRDEVLVLVSQSDGLRGDQGANLRVWVEAVTAQLDQMSVSYRLASLDSEVAKDLMSFGCVTISYRDLFTFPKVISAFCDELFFVAAAGVPAFMLELDDRLGGTEFLRNIGVHVCCDVRHLPDDLARFANARDSHEAHEIDQRCLVNTPLNFPKIIEALGFTETP